MIAAEENAERQGKEALRFTAQTLMALLSVGVKVLSYGEQPARARTTAIGKVSISESDIA